MWTDNSENIKIHLKFIEEITVLNKETTKILYSRESEHLLRWDTNFICLVLYKSNFMCYTAEAETSRRMSSSDCQSFFRFLDGRIKQKLTNVRTVDTTDVIYK